MDPDSGLAKLFVAPLGYSLDELRTWGGRLQSVRKTLFTLRLWCPAHRWPRPRTTVPDHTPEAAACDVRDTISRSWWVVGDCMAGSLRNKTDVINAAITERSLDVLALTETWHTASDDTSVYD